MKQTFVGRDFFVNLKDLRKCLLSMNIALIGMSGAGKTTLATILAKRYNKRFIDTDHLISQAEGMSINDIFARFGEEKFRSLETECIRKVCSFNNVLISTGGGVITREENMRLLKGNCFVIFLHRDIEDIIGNVDTSRRPLMRSGPDKVRELYFRRAPLYIEYADVIIDNNGNLSDLVNMTDHRLMDILEVL